MQQITRCLPLLLFALFVFTHPLAGQNTGKTPDTVQHWKAGGSFSLNFSQVALQNWAGGGQSSISGNGATDMFLNYEKAKDTWENSLDIQYGLIKQGEEGNLRKTDDELSFRSQYLRALSDNFNLTGFVDFKTAMTKGYNYTVDSSTGEERQTLIADFMAPAYLISSVGVQYAPNENIGITLSPLTGKTTFVLNEKLSEQGRYGVEPGSYVRQEVGSNLNIALKGKPIKNVSYTTEANFFSAYETPAEIDVNWKAKISLNINQYLVTTISTNLIYDEDIMVQREDGTVGPAVQFKEVLAVGFNCTL